MPLEQHAAIILNMDKAAVRMVEDGVYGRIEPRPQYVYTRWLFQLPQSSVRLGARTSASEFTWWSGGQRQVTTHEHDRMANDELSITARQASR